MPPTNARERFGVEVRAYDAVSSSCLIVPRQHFEDTIMVDPTTGNTGTFPFIWTVRPVRLSP